MEVAHDHINARVPLALWFVTARLELGIIA